MTCAWGVDKVGFVIVTYGVFDAFCSMGISLLLRQVGRLTVFCIGAILNAATILALYLWIPNADEAFVFFIIASVWGVSDAIWQTQINGN